VTRAKTISSLVMIPLRRRDNPHALLVGMIGVKLGDRLLQVGCSHGVRLAAISAKVGLSGRAVAVVSDVPSAERARKGASEQGVLVEVESAPPTALPLEDASIDVAIIDDADRSFANLQPGDRALATREVRRVLRPGGRVMIIATAARQGLSALLRGGAKEAPFDPEPPLTASGFVAVRRLAEREGLVFVEAIKPRE